LQQYLEIDLQIQTGSSSVLFQKRKYITIPTNQFQLLLVQINSAKPQDVLGKASKIRKWKTEPENAKVRWDQLFLSLPFHTVEKYTGEDEMCWCWTVSL